ncbi:MAG: hypothetical protein A2Y10_15695 [Planctomycetes bacterium GWF2_41_51]|nr:MAG: hypothetical protein A2Y10_15695 [Planctomycetes bacterium GWF2_41_51]
MASGFKEKDFEILKTIAEHILLASNQLMVLSNRNIQSLRRKLSTLEKQGYILAQLHQFGRGRGRPDRIFSLTKQGIGILKSEGVIAENILDEKVLAESISAVDHQMMINWFRVHLVYLEKIISRLKIQFLSCSSPFLPETESGHCFIQDFAIDATSRKSFIPDGVFIITDTIENKSLLFFLEADCGSESLASAERHIKDVRQKIINYGAYFDKLGYKRYEESWNCRFNGFRLLFITNALSRLNNLCRLVREMPPSDFIWLTQNQAVFKEGVSGKIWVSGGNMESSRQSILGSLCQTSNI